STGGEDDLLPAFDQVFAGTRGRVVVSWFATAIPRMQRVADRARAHGRRGGFIGRRMVETADVALDLGLLRLPPSEQVAANTLDTLPPPPPARFLWWCTGE